MILGIGLDLCEIHRIEKAIVRANFLERVFTSPERTRILSATGPRRGEIAAGMFAAKEAVAKALGTGFDGFGTGDIEILPDPAGRPTCRLHDGALDRARALAEGDGFAVWVSVTHEKGMAAATAILESNQE